MLAFSLRCARDARGRDPRSGSPAAGLRSLLALVWLLSANFAAAGPEAAVTVDHSDEAVLRFTIARLDTVWTAWPLHPGGPVLYELQLPGFVNGGAPAEPRLPRRGEWIVVPPGMRPVLVTVSEEWSPADGRLVMVGATPVLRDDPEGGQPILGHELLLPGEQPRTGEAVRPNGGAAARAFSGSRPEGAGAVSLGEPVRWRGRRVAPLVVQPLAVDAEGRAMRFLRSGTWEVRFVPDAEAAGKARAGGPPAAAGGRQDPRFEHLFLNGEALKSWPPEPQVLDPAEVGLGAAGGAADAPVSTRGFSMADWRVAPAPARARGQLLGPEARLLVAQTRLYRVSASLLQQQGVLPAGVSDEQIRLYQRRYNVADPAHYLEIEVPIRIVSDGGEFSGADFFLFYGLRPRDDSEPHTTDLGDTVPGCGDPNETYNGSSATWLAPGGNVYWFAASQPETGHPWARMAELVLEPAAGTPLTNYRRTDLFEEDFGYQEWIDSAARDRYHYNSYRSLLVELPLPLYSADPSGTTGRVRVGVMGMNESASPNPRTVNLVVAAVDTVLAASPDLRSQSLQVLDSGETIGGDLLAGATATVRLQRPSATLSVDSFIDWIEFSYDALYRARDNGLTFPAGVGAGPHDLAVDGFTRGDLGLVDITDPHRPAWVVLSSDNVTGGGVAFTLSLRVPQDAGQTRRFLAQGGLASDGVAELLASRIVQVPVPVDPIDVGTRRPDLLVVTHANFSGALGRWVAHRQARAGRDGLDVHVVDVQDIYDRFSGGLRDPWAIRRFALYALHAWGSWALQLVGDANENPRGLGVDSGYAGIARDWVPTHHHAQLAGSFREILAGDSWFVTPRGDTPNFPTDVAGPPDMLVGRFPCNSVADLDVMIDKVIAAETNQADQAWRRRSLFIADDAWSYGYYNADFSVENYEAIERLFQTNEDSIAARWDRFAGGAQLPVRFFLSSYLDPHLGPQPWPTLRSTSEYRQYTAAEAVPPLLSALTDGALLVHYQGHANSTLLTHEVLIQDVRSLAGQDRRDVLNMNNAGKGFVFFGMGCHISDWAQNAADRVGVQLSLGEKMLLHAGGGACAVYASSGYEYINSNADFSTMMFDNWLFDPPPKNGPRSRWVLGEMIQAVCADVIASFGHSYYQDMTAQFVLLGDALMVLDSGPPSFQAVLEDGGGDLLEEGDAVAALDATNTRRVRLAATDEAGVDRIVLLDSAGNDLSGLVQEQARGVSFGSDQTAFFDIPLPVRPFDHSITLHVYDTADRLDSDHHPALTVRLPQTIVFYRPGRPEPVDPDTLLVAVDEPVSLTAVVTTSAWLEPTTAIALAGVNIVLGSVTTTRRSEHTIDLAFTAMIEDATPVERSLELKVTHTDGRDYTTTYRLQSGPADQVGFEISDLMAFPNPMREQLSFVFRTAAPPSAGRILLYTVSGRQVASLAVAPDAFASAGAYSNVAVPWHGRDGVGDELANGVYLYRVELETPTGAVRSGMQKLVVMR